MRFLEHVTNYTGLLGAFHRVSRVSRLADFIAFHGCSRGIHGVSAGFIVLQGCFRKIRGISGAFKTGKV